jgi:hypothetical protein
MEPDFRFFLTNVDTSTNTVRGCGALLLQERRFMECMFCRKELCNCGEELIAPSFMMGNGYKWGVRLHSSMLLRESMHTGMKAY